MVDNQKLIKSVHELMKQPGAVINAAVFGAAEGNRTELLEELLTRSGADINAAVFGAAKGNHKELLDELLKGPGANLSGPLTATERSAVSALKNLGESRSSVPSNGASSTSSKRRRNK